MNKILFLLGTLLLVLPFVLKLWDSRQQEDLIATYEQNVTKQDTGVLEQGMISAENYNRQLFESGIINQECYESELNLFGNGMMGSIEIPKISLKLPIYHGIKEEVLSRGVGHLRESSLPIGGINSHSVLAGHRGLPNAQLFTRLDELEEDDVFFIRVSNRTCSYRVKRISIVKPEETEELKIQKGEDLVSLVTCTPYGINTHRLIVTGERIAEEETIEENRKVHWISKRDVCFLMVPVLFFGGIFLRKWKKGGSRV